MRQRRHDLPIPEALDAIVMRCLKKRVNDRPKNALEVQQLLEAIPLEGLPLGYPSTVARRAPPPAPAKREPTVSKDAETLGHMPSSTPPPPPKPD
jgi:serine/threonine-protein kinase